MEVLIKKETQCVPEKSMKENSASFTSSEGFSSLTSNGLSQDETNQNEGKVDEECSLLISEGLSEDEANQNEGKVEEEVKFNYSSCTLHGKPKQYYCSKERCSCQICQVCLVLDHNDHISECKFMIQAASEAKQKLIQELESLWSIRECLTYAVGKIKVMESEIQNNAKAVFRDIKIAKKECPAVIDSGKYKMLEDVKQALLWKLKNLALQRRSLSVLCHGVSRTIHKIEACEHHSSDDEVASILTDIGGHIDETIREQRKKWNLDPVVEAGDKLDYLKQFCRTKASKQFAVTIKEDDFKTAEVDRTSEFRLTVKLSNGGPTRPSHVIECLLTELVLKTTTMCQVHPIGSGVYCVQYTPTARGRHQVSVTVNGFEVPGSPVKFIVFSNPAKLGVPLQIISGLEQPSSIAITSNEDIIVSEGSGNVVVLSWDGKKLKSFKCDESSNAISPQGVAVDREDSIYFVDGSANKVHKCNSEMEDIATVNLGNLESPGQWCIAVVRDEIMVCEKGSKGAIKVYDTDLNFTKEILPYRSCNGLASDLEGNLYVAEDGKCVKAINRKGEVLCFLDCDAQGVKKLNNPTGVCVCGQYVYVSDEGNHNISVFTTAGDYVTSFGQEGVEEGEFMSPAGLCVDDEGLLYVCDRNNHRIQVF